MYGGCARMAWSLKCSPRCRLRLVHIITALTANVYDYTCTGLFERDRLMFSFQMTIKLKEAEDAIVTLLHSLPRAHPFRASLSIAAKAKPTTAARLFQSSAHYNPHCVTVAAGRPTARPAAAGQPHAGACRRRQACRMAVRHRLGGHATARRHFRRFRRAAHSSQGEDVRAVPPAGCDRRTAAPVHH